MAIVIHFFRHLAAGESGIESKDCGADYQSQKTGAERPGDTNNEAINNETASAKEKQKGDNVRDSGFLRLNFLREAPVVFPKFLPVNFHFPPPLVRRTPHHAGVGDLR